MLFEGYTETAGFQYISRLQVIVGLDTFVLDQRNASISSSMFPFFSAFCHLKMTSL
jgi:hypothetical protein